MKKQSRTISGVTPVAVMAKPMGCPGKCVYCPTYTAAPQSYTPESPAVIRARACDFDARKQVEFRLRILAEMGHPTDKVELIVMGGTFLAAPVEYQYQFIKDCYDAMNGQTSATLEEAKTVNETTRNRCVGLCIETRPDWCSQADVERMLEFGTTRVELGVQMLDDDIYRLVHRGHEIAHVVTTTKLLRDYGFKVHYHWMPGLPGSTPENDLVLSRLLFEDSRFRPDGLKIYPTMVVSGTELEKWFQEGRYQPYDNEVMIGLIADIKALVPPYVRISRVLRDIPSSYIVGGLKDSLRDLVRERMERSGNRCRCIRCREYGHRRRQRFQIGEPRLTRLDYEAAGGKEIFLSFADDNETLFGLLRLRLQDTPLPGMPLPVAMVRELHVYGPEIALKEHPTTNNDSPDTPLTAQHRGFGRALLAEAERLAREKFGATQIAVLSGVGAKQYYTEAGYHKLGEYMAKTL
jgi:elongator complex protein 3